MEVDSQTERVANKVLGKLLNPNRVKKYIAYALNTQLGAILTNIVFDNLMCSYRILKTIPGIKK